MTQYVRITEHAIEISDLPLDGFAPIDSDDLVALAVADVESDGVAADIAKTFNAAPDSAAIVDLSVFSQDRAAIAAAVTVATLRKLATKYRIVDRSKLNESGLIEALIEAGHNFGVEQTT